MGPEPEETEDEEKRSGVERRQGGRRKFDRWYTSLYVHLPALFTIVFALLLVVLAVVAVVSVSVLRNVSDIETAAHDARDAAAIAKKNTALLRRGAFGTCERIQRLRDDVNAQANNQYDVIRVAAMFARDAKTKKLYDDFLHSTPYSPPTDCRMAVDDPLHYQPPPIVPFAEVDKCFTLEHNQIVPPCKR